MSRAPAHGAAGALLRWSPPVADLGLVEVRRLRAAVLLARGRVHREEADDVLVPYAAGSGTTCAGLVVAAALEAAVVHLAVPWERLGAWAWTAWAVLGLSVYGAGWVFLWWAARRVHPHLVRHGDGDGELVLRAGAWVAARVPLSAVVDATTRRRGGVAPDPGRLTLGGLGGDTNLDLELTGPLTVRGPLGRERRVTGVSLWVDDAAAAARAITAARDGSRSTQAGAGRAR
ncbi:hypothetical protein [Puerhibacterium sp. TATVAM-FAB25]|uniref:hypothetical protein n=1 Tax=Puerhibacterium sp. TATVAM-FAB25 TaxID=3093699 RepID=UPI00397C5A68